MKVLDVANVPDKKSFPPRLLVIFLGTTLAIAGAITWVYGSTLWQEADSQDPRKVFAQEVYSTVSARMHLFSRNGSGPDSEAGAFWSRMRRRHSSTKDQE